MTEFSVHRCRSATNVQISKLRLVGSLKGHADPVPCLSRFGGRSADLTVLSLETPASAGVSLKPPDLGVAAVFCDSLFFEPRRIRFKHSAFISRLLPTAIGEMLLKNASALDTFGGAAHFPWADSPLKPGSERNPACHSHDFHSYRPN